MQFLDNVKASYAALPGETRKTLLMLGGVGGGLILIFLLLITTFLTSSPQSATDKKTNPEITKTPEELAAMSMAPVRPTDIPFINKADIEAVRPHYTPTPTPFPGVFYIPNGQQNDLEIRYAYFEKGDIFEEIHLKNKKTLEERTVGYMYRYAPGRSAFFSNDFSQLIYLGGTKLDYQQITFYSIPQNKNLRYITLDQMKQALPQLKINQTATLSSLVASPDKTKVALSYGNTFTANKIAPDTQIIVIRLSDNKMQLLRVNGLVKQWLDETTLQYELNTLSGTSNTYEVTITDL